MLRELYRLTILIMAAPSQEPTTKMFERKKRDEESYVTECCFTRTTHLFTRHPIRNAGLDLHRHPSYLPHLALIDFCLFTKVKEFVKECKFADDEDVICTENSRLEEQDQQFFYSEIRALEKRETKCISVARIDVESDKIRFSYVVINCVSLQTF